MSKHAGTVLLILAAVLVVLFSSTFIVKQTEVAVRTQFGEIKDSTYGPGLHFKVPFIDRITKFEKRVITRAYQGETFLTNENRGLIVDYYIKWQVDDAAQYLRTTSGIEDNATQRIADIVKDGIKNAVAQRTLSQIVSAERAAVTGDMFERARGTVSELGIRLVDVRVQRIDLPEDVAARVFESMKQSFERLARQLRGEGEKESLRIKAEADRRRTEILAEAQRDSLEIRGKADAVASETYAKAYEKYPEFYGFYRSLQAYRNALGKDGDLLVISPDNEFFRYLQNPGKSR